MMSKLISGKNPSSESQKSPAFPQCQSIALIAEQWWTPADHRRQANGQWIWTVLLTVFLGEIFCKFCKWFEETSEIENPVKCKHWSLDFITFKTWEICWHLASVKRWTFADNMLECERIQASWTTTETPSAIFWDSFATNDMSNGANCICPFAKQSRLQVAKMRSSLNRQTQIGRCPVCHCGVVALLDVGASSMPS